MRTIGRGHNKGTNATANSRGKVKVLGVICDEQQEKEWLGDGSKQNENAEWKTMKFTENLKRNETEI